LLYLHSAAGETEWLPFHDLLAKQFTVYAPAHPGFVASEGLDDIRDIGDLAWHYVDLLEQLELGPVPVVGFSLGAWIALETAVLRPALSSRLVLTAAAGLHIEGAPIAEIFTDDLDRLRRLVFFDPACPAADLAVPSSLDDTRILLWMRAREATARVAWNPYLHNPRLRGHLRRITCPSLVIWGRHDQLIPLAHGEYYAAHLPRARLSILENCGHMAPLERPEEFVARVTEFALRDTTPGK
jgi:pimeloyl-ACP methyl ester carboxylesterase